MVPLSRRLRETEGRLNTAHAEITALREHSGELWTLLSTALYANRAQEHQYEKELAALREQNQLLTGKVEHYAREEAAWRRRCDDLAKHRALELASSPSFAEVCGGPLGGRELNLEFLHHLFGASVTGFLRPSLPPLRRYLATVWPEAHVAYRAVAIYLWIHLYLQDRTTNYRHLADQVGCTPTQVDHILTAAPRPDYELIIDLAEALHADRLWIARLLRRAGIQPPGSRSGPPHPSHGTPPTSSRFLRETVDLAGLLNPTAPGADNPARRPPPPTPPKPSD